ncbi:uncharacterized protein PHALS_11478 [Plasmopara halstedii]|uniref:Uncharacterized protein n=1 Tax=Plasmopara halstedii TaxID=4781 RepID=A0A0P1A633_PLAHL|nr:uncharacterized protein PHALS_11478 [Plasmopara halstedii]CEG35607.1 hypothetical protein PHALS_11478 [Plasmopara halstedii]|eukprot:XP_024571976.1 hypothetical protein PHALS_11478 [Plasmopara halstedii]
MLLVSLFATLSKFSLKSKAYSYRMTESRRKRVQQKGRFTITEIIPASPSSTRMSSSTFLDDEISTEDFSSTTGDALSPSQLRENINQSNKFACDLAVSSVLVAEKSLKQPVKSVPIEDSITNATEVTNSVVESVVKVSISTPCAMTAPSSPSRKYSSPKKMNQRTRRIRRRGRFTIIEMASDSPTCRKNADDLNDHRFVTTTTVEDSSNVMPQQHSLDNLERRTKPKRTTRSLSRLQKSSALRRFRRRSESPTRGGLKPVEMMTSSRNLQQQPGRGLLPHLMTESSNTLSKSAIPAASVGDCALASASQVRSMTSLAIPDNQSSVANTSISAEQDKSPVQVSLYKSPKNSITITTAQFVQQQQTIASLIRQQHDLKEIICVLQEQQQQLLIIPSQINELKRQKLNLDGSETRDNEMRELLMKVDTLTATNEKLHSLINAADREARHRALEIECLSEENDELRHRCGQLETRYMDERKQGFVLEEELQRLRMLSLSLQEQHVRQQQRQGQNSLQATV